METKIGGIALERSGSGEPLLLLHGTGGSRMHWRPVLGRLASSRDVLVVDLPGHGASDPPPDGVAHTPIGYAELLGKVLDELELESVHVAGNSVGGWTSLELAKNGRARSVVAIDPAGLWAKRDPWRCVFQLWSQHKMGRAFAPITPRLLRSPTGRAILMSGTVAKPKQVPAEDAIEMAEVYASTPCFDQHLAETRRARFADGGGIEAPVTIAWGEKDRLLPAKARLTDELPSQARELTLPGCGHLPMWDDPELVTRTILEGGAESRPARAAQSL
jgi:pimeloyl-ACP methyl ester carboxylesterase